MATFGSVAEYNASLESWTLYTERLEQFFLANGIVDDGRKRAIFLTVVGPATYSLLRNLISPAIPTEKTLAELLETLNAHYDPVPSEIIERFKFNSRVRHAGESVADFIAELRRLAKFCNYGTVLNEMLRDRIVCGIQEEAIQRKLLAEAGLTLARASEIAVAMEAAARDAVDLRIGTSAGNINKIQSKNFTRRKQKFVKDKPSPAEFKPAHQFKKCHRCGDTSHTSQECRFKNATCHNCQKLGHLMKVCKSQKKSAPSVHRLQKVQTSDANVLPKTFTLLNVASIGEAPPPAKVLCKIAGKPLTFEVDSGAPFSIMPKVVFEKIKRLVPPLQESDIKLQSYTSHVINVLGVTHVDVSFQSRSSNLPLLVVEQGNVNLAGRNWIVPLGLMSAFEDISNTQEVCSMRNVAAAKQTVDGLMHKFKDLFSPTLGIIKGVKVHLTQQSAADPRFFKARPVPYALREKVDKEIERLVQVGILEPVKTSSWAAPIVPVLKQDGRVRICGDFKLTVNKATILEQYPLPRIEDLFAQLSGGDLFTKLDLQDAYCQLELDDSSRDLVVINTHKGLFRYTRLPFGVASAPAIFQREIDKILQGLKGASCYLDDLLITGKDDAEHMKNLSQVLHRLEAAGIRLHPKKCEFLKSSVEYLGHRIDRQGLHPVESKIEAVVKAPDPKNVDELRSFIGLVTYYAKFLPNMAILLAPMYKLLEKKQEWQWGTQEEEAFVKIKDTLKNSSLLVHFDNNKEVVLACDASPYGLGAVLSHSTPEGDRPIAFASRTLSKAEKNYSHIEKEALALVFGVTRFRNYLLGRTFTLLTDHQPLVTLLSEDKPVPSVAAARIQRWALTLSAYSYKIKYRKGKLHGNADACSRLPLKIDSMDPPQLTESVLMIEQLNDTPVTAHMIATEIEKSPMLSLLRSYIFKGWPKKIDRSLQSFWQVRNELSIVDNIICRGSRVFVPPKFQKYVLEELHSSHQGICAIKALARSYVWWPGIDTDLEAKVKQCVSCQENASAPPSQQVSWPVPQESWVRIHIDHAGPVDGQMLLIVVDASSKWLEVFPVPNTSSSATIKVLRNIFARFGIPRSLVSDNGTAFTSFEFLSFLGKNGITHIRTAPYHPNSNGLAERSVRTVKSALQKIDLGTFDERLARFLFNYRNTPLAATKVSPAVKMLGRSLRSRLDLLKSQVETQAESPEKNTVIKVGDAVWVRQFGRGPRWIPGTVLSPVGQVMFKVQTCKGTWTRHVDQIRGRVAGGDASSDVTISSTSGLQNSQSSSEVAPVDIDLPVLSPKKPSLSLPSPASDPEFQVPPVLSPQVEIRTNNKRQETVVQSPGTPVLRRSKRLAQRLKL